MNMDTNALKRSAVTFVAALVSITLTAIGFEDVFDIGQISNLVMALAPIGAFVGNYIYRVVVPTGGGRTLVTFVSGLLAMVVVALGLDGVFDLVQVEALAVAVVPVLMWIGNVAYRAVVPAVDDSEMEDAGV